MKLLFKHYKNLKTEKFSEGFIYFKNSRGPKQNSEENPNLSSFKDELKNFSKNLESAKKSSEDTSQVNDQITAEKPDLKAKDLNSIIEKFVGNAKHSPGLLNAARQYFIDLSSADSYQKHADLSAFVTQHDDKINDELLTNQVSADFRVENDAAVDEDFGDVSDAIQRSVQNIKRVLRLDAISEEELWNDIEASLDDVGKNEISLKELTKLLLPSTRVEQLSVAQKDALLGLMTSLGADQNSAEKSGEQNWYYGVRNRLHSLKSDFLEAKTFIAEKTESVVNKAEVLAGSAWDYVTESEAKWEDVTEVWNADDETIKIMKTQSVSVQEATELKAKKVISTDKFNQAVASNEFYQKPENQAQLKNINEVERTVPAGFNVESVTSTGEVIFYTGIDPKDESTQIIYDPVIKKMYPKGESADSKFAMPPGKENIPLMQVFSAILSGKNESGGGKLANVEDKSLGVKKSLKKMGPQAMAQFLKNLYGNKAGILTEGEVKGWKNISKNNVLIAMLHENQVINGETGMVIAAKGSDAAVRSNILKQVKDFSLLG